MATETNSAPDGVEEAQTAPLPPKLRVNPVNMSLGLSLGAVALWAVKVDAVNNYTFGLTMGHEAAQVALVAALAVVLIPVARITDTGKPYDRVLACVQWACVLITAFCAFFAYLNTAGQDMAERDKANKEYHSAASNASGWRDEARRQRAKADAIEEGRSLSTLGPAVERAQASYRAALAYAEGQKLPCQRSRTCREALATLTPLEDAKAKAEGKQEALRLAKEADGKAEAAEAMARSGKPSEPQIYATLAAGWTGWQAERIEKGARMFMAVLNIVVTVLLSTIVGYAAAALKASIWWEDPNKPAPTSPAGGRKPRTSPMVASIMAKAQETPGKGLAGFVARCEMSDEWTPVAEIAKALDLYLRATNSFEHVSRQRLNAALTGHGFAYEANNKSKRTPARYGLKLPVIKSPHLASVG